MQIRSGSLWSLSLPPAPGSAGPLQSALLAVQPDQRPAPASGHNDPPPIDTIFRYFALRQIRVHPDPGGMQRELRSLVRRLDSRSRIPRAPAPALQAATPLRRREG